MPAFRTRSLPDIRNLPVRTNDRWREPHDNDPAGWADAVAFDRAIRHGHEKTMNIPTVDDQPMLPVWPYAGLVIGRRRSAVLDLAKRYADGDTSVLPFAVYRIGRRYLVRTVELRRFIGCDSTDTATLTASTPRPPTAAPMASTRPASSPGRRGDPLE